MILDAFLTFSGVVPAAGIGNIDNTDSPTTGTQTSSNVIDLHISGIPVLAANQGARDMGIGDSPALKMLVQVVTAFASGTSLQVILQGAPDNGSGAPGTFVNWWSSAAVVEASLTVGARLYDMDMPRPPPGVAVPRFLRMSYVTVGTHTAGKIYAGIVLDRFDQMYQGTNNAILGAYPPGIAIAN
jgi:hypothetical protein